MGSLSIFLVYRRVLVGKLCFNLGSHFQARSPHLLVYIDEVFLVAPETRKHELESQTRQQGMPWLFVSDQRPWGQPGQSFISRALDPGNFRAWNRMEVSKQEKAGW